MPLASSKVCYLYRFAEEGNKKAGESETGSDVVEVANEKEDESVKKYYDKSASFFDRISCEALEKEEGCWFQLIMFCLFIQISGFLMCFLSERSGMHDLSSDVFLIYLNF